jgi:uncharacterized protein
VPLEDGWQACFNPAGPGGVAVLNASAQKLLAACDPPASLVSLAHCFPQVPPVAVWAAVEELVQIGLLRPADSPAATLAQVTTLSAWLHVTEACNLNCPYCYVHKRPATMSADTGRRAVDRLVELAQRHGYSALKIKYAGGEPTLNFAVVEAIHAHAARHAAQAGLVLEEVVLSNGVGLTDEMLAVMERAGMRLMVSLDGGPQAHDSLRARRDGRSTYAAVVDTVDRARLHGLQPHISITLTARNLQGVEEAVAFALERHLPFNLNFFRECSTSDPVAGASSLVPDPGQLVETLLGIFDLLGQYPAYPLPFSGILDRTRLDLPHSQACSAGRDYLVVDALGRVSGCQMMLEQPWSSLIDDDPLQEIRRRGADLFRSVDDRSECQACPWRMACGGGCPLLRQTSLHDDYCQVYQALFPELLRLEGNRLVANQSL